MERILLFASLLIGVLVWGVAVLLPQRAASAAPPPENGEDSPWKTLLGKTAIALPFLGFLLTLPTSGKFFSPGQDLGRGFLIGGIAALLVAGSALRQRKANAPGSVEGAFALAAAAVSLALLFLRSGIIDALTGIAIGWLTTTFPLYLAIRRTEPETATQLVSGVGFAATLCGAACLGIWRDSLTPAIAKTTWSATLTAFSALSALVVLVFRLVMPSVSSEGASRNAALPVLIYTVLAAGAMKLLTVKIATEPRLFYAVAAGLIVWPVAQWLLFNAETKDTARNPRSLAGLPPLAALLIVGGFVASFQLIHGLGAGAYAVALWLSSAAFPRRRSDITGMETALLLFGTVLLLDRVFGMRYTDEMKGVVLTDQYGLFGLMVGALTPGLLSSLVGRRSQAGSGGILLLVLAGTLALGVPALVVLLFGGKSALALLLGLALGSAMTFQRGDSRETTPGSSLLPGLFALASALALNQFTGLILPLTEMTRLHKVELLGALVSGVVIALLAAEMATRGAASSRGTDGTSEVA